MCRLLGLAGIATFLVCGFTPLPNALGRWMAVTGEIAPAGAIVVLGSSLRPDGTLDDSSFRRAIHGVVLRRNGLAPLLVLSGVTLGPRLSETTTRAALARALGIADDDLVTVTGVRTTREETQALSRVLRARHVHRLLLVTDALHMARARQLFVRAGFEVFAAPSDDVSTRVTGPRARLKLTRQMIEEVMARGYYRVAGYL